MVTSAKIRGSWPIYVPTTQNGLKIVSSDGTYTTKTTADGLSSNEVIEAAAYDGKVYIATNSGLDVMTIATGGITHLNAVRTVNVYVSASGILYFKLGNGDRFRYDIATATQTAANTNWGNFLELGSSNKIAESQDGMLYFSSGFQIYKFNEATQTTSQVTSGWGRPFISGVAIYKGDIYYAHDVIPEEMVYSGYYDEYDNWVDTSYFTPAAPGIVGRIENGNGIPVFEIPGYHYNVGNLIADEDNIYCSSEATGQGYLHVYQNVSQPYAVMKAPETYAMSGEDAYNFVPHKHLARSSVSGKIFSMCSTHTDMPSQSRSSSIRLITTNGVESATPDLWNPEIVGPKAMYTTELPLSSPPTDLALSASTVVEGSGELFLVGTLTPTGGVAPYVYTLEVGTGSTHNGLFAIYNDNELWATSSFDYENMPADAIGNTVSVLIQVASGEATYQKAFHITVTDIGLPTALSVNPQMVNENAAVGTTVGTISQTGGDADVTYSYSLPDDYGFNSSFTIDGDSLKTSAVFDYETKSSYAIKIKATSVDGEFEQLLTVQVRNVNEAGNVVINGLPKQGETLSFTLTDPDGVLGTYPHWQDSVTNMELTNTPTFLLTQDHVGKQIRLVVNYSTVAFVNNTAVALTEVIVGTGVDLPSTGTDAPVMVGSLAVGTVIADPRSGVTYNGNPLPAGSVLRNTTTGQKFIAGGTSITDFTAIEITPPAAWGFSVAGDTAWAVLQDL
jgi:hypothetical protein